MPVIIGDNLTLEDNKLSAVYKELYSKLNRAYAWTNTQVGGENGTISSYTNKNIFLKTINCDNSSKFSLCGYYNTYGFHYYILNGEIFVNYRPNTVNNIKIGDKSNWVLCSTSQDVSFSSTTNWTCYLWAINSSGELYYLYYRNNNGTFTYTETQIGSSGWTDLSYFWAINEGKLYKLSSSTATQQGSENTWTYISKPFQDGYDYGYLWFKKDNYIYTSYNNQTPFLAITNPNVKLFSGYASNSSSNYIIGSYIDTDDNIYYKDGNSSGWVLKGNIPNIKKIHCLYGSNWRIQPFVTSDGKAGYLPIGNYWSPSSITEIQYFDKNIYWSDVSPCICTGSYTIPGLGTGCYGGFVMAIGDGKLYKIYVPTYYTSGNNGHIIYEIIDNNTNWIKVYGTVYVSRVYGTDSTDGTTFYAFNNSSELVTITTVYTTKKPIIGDETYLDNTLNKMTIITGTSLPSTITDEYLTYTRDSSKDSHFSEIPPASIHETVSVIDILNATNPNN